MREDTRIEKERLRKEMEKAKHEQNYEKMKELKHEYFKFNLERRRFEARERARKKKEQNKEILREYFKNLE